MSSQVPATPMKRVRGPSPYGGKEPKAQRQLIFDTDPDGSPVGHLQRTDTIDLDSLPEDFVLPSLPNPVNPVVKATPLPEKVNWLHYVRCPACRSMTPLDRSRLFSRQGLPDRKKYCLCDGCKNMVDVKAFTWKTLTKPKQPINHRYFNSDGSAGDELNDLLYDKITQLPSDSDDDFSDSSSE